MPGTGKTTTIARLVQLIVADGKSVLLTAYTNSAVDTILLKLLEFQVPFIRLGRIESIDARIHPHSAEARIASMNTVDEVRSFYESSHVIASTCQSATKFRRTFDYCIVDEASQVIEVCQSP